MSEPAPKADWAAAVAEWRKTHSIDDNHPVLLTVQLMEVWHRQEQDARSGIDATLEELGSDVASLGEGFAELQKQVAALRGLIDKPPVAPPEPSLPTCIVVGIALSAIVAGFCLGRAFL